MKTYYRWESWVIYPFDYIIISNNCKIPGENRNFVFNPFTGTQFKKLDKYKAKFWNNFKYLHEYIWISICAINCQNLSFDCKFCLDFEKTVRNAIFFIQAWKYTPPPKHHYYFTINIVIIVAACINLKKIAIIMINNMYNQLYHVRVRFPCLREASF